MRKNQIIELLTNRKGEIIRSLQNVVDNGTFNYTTFGKNVETPLTAIIIGILKKEKLITSDSQFRVAKDKNEFPDLTIFSNPAIALEMKAGNRSKKERGVWKVCKNSNNDLVTLNKLQEKLDAFGGRNIFFVFTEYDFTDTKQKIVDVKIKPFYLFVGINKAGALSYREKDGNLRPKGFDEVPPIKSLKQFIALIPFTIYYRSMRIIAKHRKIIQKLKDNGFRPSDYRSRG